VLRIWYPVSFWLRDPGWVKNQDPDLGWAYQIIFPKAWKHFFGFKILKFFYVDSDPGSGIFLTWDPGSKSSDPGSGDKLPGSATLIQTIFFSECTKCSAAASSTDSRTRKTTSAICTNNRELDCNFCSCSVLRGSSALCYAECFCYVLPVMRLICKELNFKLDLANFFSYVDFFPPIMSPFVRH
jgi:hypothetical protein